MKSETRERWDRNSALAGACVWLVLAALAGAGKAPLGSIELLFLFAPLVIVPLGLSLVSKSAPFTTNRLEDAARRIQPFAALLTVASFWFSPGPIAGGFAAGWAAVCTLLAASGAYGLLRLRSLTPAQFAANIAANIGRLDLAIGAFWLLLSRFGIHPASFQEPIVLLTAVHFHYTGFATAILAATASEFSHRTGDTARFTDRLVILVTLLPFLIAAGFVLSPALKVTAVTVFSLSIVAFAIWQFALSRRTSNKTVRGFLALSSLSVLAGMTLAFVYAVSDWLGQAWLTIPRMAGTHGWLNGIGFVLHGLLGWQILWTEIPNSVVNAEEKQKATSIRPTFTVPTLLAFFSDYEPPHLRRAYDKNKTGLSRRTRDDQVATYRAVRCQSAAVPGADAIS